METKYGELPNELLDGSLNRLIAKVYKILPMKEEACHTLNDYIEGLIRELIGQREIVYSLKSNSEFLSVLGVLESLLDQEEMSIYKKDVFKAISLIKRVHSDLT